MPSPPPEDLPGGPSNLKLNFTQLLEKQHQGTISPLPLEKKDWQVKRRVRVFSKQGRMPADGALLRNQAEVGPHEPGKNDRTEMKVDHHCRDSSPEPTSVILRSIQKFSDITSVFYQLEGESPLAVLFRLGFGSEVLSIHGKKSILIATWNKRKAVTSKPL